MPTAPEPPPSHRPAVTLAHGGGGRLTQDLIDRIFLPAFGRSGLGQRHDGAVLPPAPGRLALTTDSHVVSPLFFPGGDIGRLAVNGTVNDLAMCGARPLWLSAGFILEEGLPLDTLGRIARSMGEAAAEAGIEVAAGDTKVVERGRGDGLYLTTAGLGVIEHPLTIAPASIRPGDAVLLSGDIGRHGMAVMACREGLSFESAIESDCAPLWPAVSEALGAGLDIHCLRDLTRGGLATALVELAEAGGVAIEIEEAAVRVTEPVRGACEILGLDSLYVANEGRFVCLLPEKEAERALEILSRRAPGGPPAVIGRVRAGAGGLVSLRTILGSERVLERLSGEQLPRIC